jgi:hypothetical protein
VFDHAETLVGDAADGPVDNSKLSADRNPDTAVRLVSFTFRDSLCS